MKSFADWTDDIAQSVGEVKHHWEDGALEPRWQASADPGLMQDISDPMPSPSNAFIQSAVKYANCDWCGDMNYLFVDPSDPNGPCVCKKCLDSTQPKAGGTP